jgi:glyoxylase-like metal-dependent hydrolase (beta-lactamase superfamily II)
MNLKTENHSQARRVPLMLAGTCLGLAGLVGLAHAQQNQAAAVSELQMIPVQGNVYLLAGAGGNIAVQVGSQGTLIVDTGLADRSDQIIAAIHKLTPKPIQYIINTHFHADHTGGNDALRKAGTTYTGANVTANLTDVKLGAQVFAHDNVLLRMSAPTGKQASTPFGSWPTLTFFEDKKQMSFNGEPIEIMHQPAAHTDGDSIVLFRRSDVIAAGDIFLTTTYPFIDLEHGGSIQGEIDGLNSIIEIAVPLRQEEGGTYVIPGHGRIADRFEVVEYRDMVTIVRDRIRAAIKDGMMLEQIKSAKLSLDYDYRYGAKSGLGTTDNFIQAVYQSLTKTK